MEAKAAVRAVGAREVEARAEAAQGATARRAVRAARGAVRVAAASLAATAAMERVVVVTEGGVEVVMVLEITLRCAAW